MARRTDRTNIEFAKCAADAAYFIHHYGIIDDVQDHGDGGGTMPFHLWPAQVKVLWLFLIHRLCLILKARQLGISWICCGYALWLCIFQPGKSVLLFSKSQREAVEMLRRIRVMYQRLPDWLLDVLPKVTQDNTEIITWANGSSCRSLPGTGGRSFTATLVILDEAAHIGAADELYMALKPTIDAGGQLIVLSTAKGFGNLFHLLWVKAEAKANKFCAIFLPWWSRPSRTAQWYEDQKAEYTDPNMIHQEYPATAREAFVSSGNTRFAGKWIEDQEGNIEDPLPSDQWPDTLRDALKGAPGAYVFRVPEAGRRYIVAADVAEGGEKGDFSTAVIIDAGTWEEVAGWHGRIEPDTFAEYLVALSNAYREPAEEGPVPAYWGDETLDDEKCATIAHERNNHGHTVTATIKRLVGAARMYLARDGKRAWLTNAQTKPEMINLLAEALRDGLCKVRSVGALNEMAVYKVLDDGSTGAPVGYHDDRVMAWAIAVSVARRGRRVIDADRMG